MRKLLSALFLLALCVSAQAQVNCPLPIVKTGAPYYWIASDHNPGTQVFSVDPGNSPGTYVSNASSGYTTWTAGGCVAPTLTQAQIFAILDQWAHVTFTQASKKSLSTGVSVQLTNPAVQFLQVAATSGGLIITLPSINQAQLGTFPTGASFDLQNNGANTFTLSTFAGGSTFTIPPGTFWRFWLTDNPNTDGSWQTYGQPSLNGTAAATGTMYIGAGGGVMNLVSPGQLPGTTTNDSATAGNIGEYVSSTIASGSAVSLTNATPANITSISLTAGDWDVWIDAHFTGGGTTTVNYLEASISTTSATISTTPGQIGSQIDFGSTPFNFTADAVTVPVGPVRLSLASTTTVFFVAKAGFGTSTCSGFGIIQARRRR